MLGLAGVWERCFKFSGNFEGIESTRRSANGLMVSRATREFRVMKVPCKQSWGSMGCSCPHLDGFDQLIAYPAIPACRQVATK